MMLGEDILSRRKLDAVVTNFRFQVMLRLASQWQYCLNNVACLFKRLWVLAYSIGLVAPNNLIVPNVHTSLNTRQVRREIVGAWALWRRLSTLAKRHCIQSCSHVRTDKTRLRAGLALW